MKYILRKILGYFLLSLILPMVLLIFQLIFQIPMPFLKDYEINLYLQPIIWGFGLDVFFGLIIFLINKGLDLIN